MSINTASPMTGDLSLNQITAQQPNALEVFNRLGLDSCCGGAKSLAVVCEQHQLDLDDVLRQLRDLTAR